MILFGGIETTEGDDRERALHLLATPTALAHVRADPALLAGAVEESLRLEPAAAVIDRYAHGTSSSAAPPIRARRPGRLSLAGANRDPAVFPDPDRFDLRRANAKLQVAFAHGPHVCLGMHLARLETRIALRAPARAAAGPAPRPRAAERRRGLVFRKPQAVHGRLGRRRAVPLSA